MFFRTAPAVLVVLAGLVVGCSSGGTDAGRHGPQAPSDRPDATPSASDSDAELAWAQALVDEHAGWQPTTTDPTYTSASMAVLCRPSPVPADYGPHIEHAYWVYTNPESHEAFLAHDDIPVGGVIVKQKHEDWRDADGHREPVALGVMIKREPGYDPGHGDWEYAYITLDDTGRVTDATRGRISTCIDCHANQARTDYLFRGYLYSRFEELPVDELFGTDEPEPDRVSGPPLLRED